MIKSEEKQNSLNQHDIYKKWVLRHYPDSIKMIEQKNDFVSRKKPEYFTIIIPVYNPNIIHLMESVESVLAQTYSNFELIIVNNGSTINISGILEEIEKLSDKIKIVNISKNCSFGLAIKESLKISKGSYITFLNQKDILWPNALYEFSQEIAKNPEIEFIYCDEDKILNEERFNHFDPFFKPDWNSELLLSINYIDHGFLVKRDVIENYRMSAHYKYEAEKWAFNLWISRVIKGDLISHIEKILYSCRVDNANVDRILFDEPTLLEQQEQLITKHLEKSGISKDDIIITNKSYAPSAYDVNFKIDNKPLVSIVIPNKNQYDVLKRCIDSLYSKTSYENIEVIVIDTGTRDSKVISWYDSAKQIYNNFKVYNFLEDKFNYSNSCNFGATKASGEYLIMLNNDTEIIQGNWIELMLGKAKQPHIGCVGVQLWYPGHQSLQHTGIATGVNGVATNLMNGMDASDIITKVQRYYTNFSREITAVTAACLMIKTSLFNEISGFDPRFRITFNDVDLCLRVLEKGYQNIYLSNVELLHHESISVGHTHEEHRENDEFRESERLFNERWSSYVKKDPNFNSNFSTETSKFEIPNNY